MLPTLHIGVQDANQAVGCLLWGEAEARVAFMPLSGIRCDCVAEREGSRHFRSPVVFTSGLFVFVWDQTLPLPA